MEDIKKTLDKKLENNDKHITDIIMNYAYPTCCSCGDMFDGEYKYRYDKQPICLVCYLLMEWKSCGSCDYYFDVNKNNFCKSCGSNCRVFCPYCIVKKYKIDGDDYSWN